MGIAFLPIDIVVQLPDEQKLLDYLNNFKMIKNNREGHSHWWDVIPVLMRGEKGLEYNMANSTELIANRYNANMGTPNYINDIDKVFPEIPYMLNQLPFKELTVVAMLCQNEAVDYHTDGLPNDIDLDPTEVSEELEPKRYNILLTKHDYKDCFFVSNKTGGTKIYPSISKERPCHVISDRKYAHGAEYRGPDKIMLAVIGGILDRPRHFEMIQKNLKKYPNEAVIYP